jgi:outer membrane protein assembly factor BamB
MFLLVSLGISPLIRAQARPGPAPDPIEGIWVGTISAPQGTDADFGLEFYRTPQGMLTFRMNFPEMRTYAQAFMIPVKADGHGGYALVDAFDISLHLDGGRLSGTFGKGRLPVNLARSDRFPPPSDDVRFPEAPALVWRRDLGSGTWAPPVVSGESIYVGTVDGKFHAVRSLDGSPEWTWLGPHGIDGRAVVADGRIYFVDSKVNLVALSKADGRLCWRAPLHDPALAGGPVPDNPTFNHRAATPLVLDGVVYCGSSDGGLYALDAGTGAKLWRHDAGAPVFSGIAVTGSGALMFGTMDGSVVVLDPRTRAERPRMRTAGGVVTTPLIEAGRLIVGSRDYLLYGFNPATGSPEWRYSYWFSWVESTPVAAGGLIYVGASDYARVTALDPRTGRARWSTPVGGMNWGSPLVTQDRVFTGTASQNIPGTAISHLGGIVALDRATGRGLWRMRAADAPEGGFGGYAGTLALAGETLIAAGFDGSLVALPVH